MKHGEPEATGQPKPAKPPMAPSLPSEMFHVKHFEARPLSTGAELSIPHPARWRGRTSEACDMSPQTAEMFHVKHRSLEEPLPAVHTRASDNPSPDAVSTSRGSA